jgi:hypothetical protein
MTYTKPEVVVLGGATEVIQSTTSSKLINNVADGVNKPKRQFTAYDLDE